MKKTIVWQLLRRNISVAQLTGYAIANLVGLAIVITALQFYGDVTEVWNSDDSFISRDYVIISKKVSGVNFDSHQSEFTQAEIDDISSQPWLRRMGEFEAAGFGVSASLDIWGRGMSTALFLEAIPDEFFDVKPRGWEWEPSTDLNAPELPELPIIISKDYLTLYNFGFAASRGYPQISEHTISDIPLRVSISGRGHQKTMQARIVGFSSRLNTFAVPQAFIDWGNTNFADEPDAQPSRLILEVKKPGDPAVTQYLQKHGYESAGDKADSGRAAYFLSVITAVVMSVGVVISLLAFFILLLSIYLLLQKNKEKLRMLMMLGYSPMAVARHYFTIVGCINAVVLVGAIVAMIIGQHLWKEPLSQIGVESSSLWLSIGVGTLIMVLITIGNFIAIASNVRKTFPHPHRDKTSS